MKTFLIRNFTSATHYYLFSEYVGEQNLVQYRKNVKELHEERVWDFINQMSKALNYMNSYPHFTIHRDFKLENIILKSGHDFHLVLADYGLCKSELTNYVISDRGTFEFKAPELKNQKDEQDVEFPFKCDVYSFGRSIIHFILGSQFLTLAQNEIILKNDPNKKTVMDHLMDHKPSEALFELIENMIEEDPKFRFDIKEVIAFYENNRPSKSKTSLVFPKPGEMKQKISNKTPNQRTSNSTSSSNTISRSSQGISKQHKTKDRRGTKR